MGERARKSLLGILVVVARHQFESGVDAGALQIGYNPLRIGLHRLECLDLRICLAVAELPFENI